VVVIANSFVQTYRTLLVLLCLKTVLMNVFMNVFTVLTTVLMTVFLTVLINCINYCADDSVVDCVLDESIAMPIKTAGVWSTVHALKDFAFHTSNKKIIPIITQTNRE